MEVRRDNPSNLQLVIENDLANGSSNFVDFILLTLKEKTGTEEDIFELAGSDLVQIDLGIGTAQTHRLDLHKYDTRHGLSTRISLWAVNERGWPISDSYSLTNFPTGDGRLTYLDGSSQGSIDGGDLRVSPEQFASSLESAFENLNEFNWRIVVGGDTRPEGQI